MHFKQHNGLRLAVVASAILGFSMAYADTTELPAVVISDTQHSLLSEVSQPSKVLGRDQLERQSNATLGEVLDALPGLANASFGAGVGRPVIRGMSGHRVKVLQNGIESADVAAMSSDHAPMVDTNVAEQVEVLYGPSTLPYGGAVGGMVNVIDKRIHEQYQPGASAQVGAGYSSADRGFRVDTQADFAHQGWVLHLDGFKRDAQDYRSGKGKVLNSDREGQGGAVALSKIVEQGFIGVSASQVEYDYAVPNLEGEAFRVQPKQQRFDLKSAWYPEPTSALGWLSEWRNELSYSDYQHQETEPGVTVGLFEQQSWEYNTLVHHHLWRHWHSTLGMQVKYQELALCHDHHGCDGIANIAGAWDGQLGDRLQAQPDHGGYAYAHDTPMPLTDSTQVGLFMVEQRDWRAGTIELGARVDQVRISSDPSPISHEYRQAQQYYADKTFTPVTLSAAATWMLDEQQRLGLSVARVQRAPNATELFWNGDHHATFAYQLDNPDLDVETAYTLDLNWSHHSERNQVRVAAYYYHFDDYIYNELKPYGDPFHQEDVYRYEQRDARIYGAEFSWLRTLSDTWQLDVSGDWVKARTAAGENLPRTPPASLLMALNWQKAGWQLRSEAKALLQQRATAATESSTAGFVLWNMFADYRYPLAHGELHWQASVQNLTDKYAQNHVSYLKDAAPMLGRNLQLGVRYQF